MKFSLKDKSIIKKLCIAFAVMSLILLYTQPIYIYNVLTIKSLSYGMITGIIFWLIYLALSIYLVIINNQNNHKLIKIKNLVINIGMLLLVTILLTYNIGNNILKLYEITDSNFNKVMYIIFGIFFVLDFVSVFILDKKIKEQGIEEKGKKKKKK